jgi:hypothetical protein
MRQKSDRLCGHNGFESWTILARMIWILFQFHFEQTILTMIMHIGQSTIV